jgi:histidinol-phosphate phosphatase family protein
MMTDEIEEAGGRIDGICYCPHHPDEGCECRKPNPKLILQAAEEHGISLDAFFMIGDMEMDVLADQSAGCQTILLRKKDADGHDISGGTKPDLIADGIVEAIDWILKQA